MTHVSLATKTHKVAHYWNMRGSTYSRSWQSLAKKRMSKMETEFVHKAIATLKNKSKKDPIKVLDIGIAIGRISDEILKHNVELYGTDISKTMIDFCRRKYVNNKKVKKIQIHDIQIPLPKNLGEFDLVTAYRVLSYNPVSNLPRQLTNIYNAMNVGGKFIFTFPNRYSTMFIPKLLSKESRLGYELDYKTLVSLIENAGFSEYQIVGFTRLLDTFYDRSNSKIATNILFGIEKIFSIIFGKRLFVRMFYIACIK